MQFRVTSDQLATVTSDQVLVAERLSVQETHSGGGGEEYVNMLMMVPL